MQPGGFQPQFQPPQYPQPYGGQGPWGQGPQMRPERPAGVTVLALLGMFGGGMLMLMALAFGVVAVAFGGFAASQNNTAYDFGRQLGPLLAAGGVAVAVGLFLGGLLGFVIARGLWNQRNWARVLYMISCGLSVLSSLLAVVGALTAGRDGGAAVMITTVPMAALYVWIIAYLMKRDVAATFS